jgi:hypothetical protein
VISAGIAACTIYTKRNVYKVSTLIVFYLFASTITWVGEFIVLGFFNSYAYKTGLFTDTWAQNLLGHLLLNTTMYPAAAIVMAAYSLRNAWISVVVAIFVLIEYLFGRVGFYEHHWWRYYMSVITIVAFILISRSWFLKMNQKRYGLTRYITFYFIAMIIIHTHAPILLLSGKQYYQMSFINTLADNLNRSSIIIIFTYHLVESFFIVLCVCILKKWYWKLLPFIFAPAVQIIFTKMNILVIQDSWKLIYTVFIYEISIAIFILIEKYSLKPDSWSFEKIVQGSK